MFVGIYLVTVYDPSTMVNDGFHDLVDVIIIPEGTILNPGRPATLSTRTHLLGTVMDLLSGLLGQQTAEIMTAGGFSDSPHFMYSGFREDGTYFLLYQIGFGGIPARPVGDVMDGHCLWPGTKSVPNEFLELNYPLRIEEYSTVPDSEGAGFYRGGNAQRIHYLCLEDAQSLSTTTDGSRTHGAYLVATREPEATKRLSAVVKARKVHGGSGSVQKWTTLKSAQVTSWST